MVSAALRYGTPPHRVSWIDRLEWSCQKRQHSLVFFPKTQTGLDPLTGAPTEVDPVQLAELGLKLIPNPKPAPPSSDVEA